MPDRLTRSLTDRWNGRRHATLLPNRRSSKYPRCNGLISPMANTASVFSTTASTGTTRKATCCGSPCCDRRNGRTRTPTKENTISLTLYPHAGTWREALTVRRGCELNYPLLALPVDKHEGALPAVHGFVQIQPEDVVLTAMKKAEDDGSLVVRFYEWA